MSSRREVWPGNDPRIGRFIRNRLPTTLSRIAVQRVYQHHHQRESIGSCPDTFSIDGFAWMQGEDDQTNVTPEPVSYGANLLGIVAAIWRSLIFHLSPLEKSRRSMNGQQTSRRHRSGSGRDDLNLRDDRLGFGAASPDRLIAIGFHRGARYRSESFDVAGRLRPLDVTSVAVHDLSPPPCSHRAAWFRIVARGYQLYGQSDSAATSVNREIRQTTQNRRYR